MTRSRCIKDEETSRLTRPEVIVAPLYLRQQEANKIQYHFATSVKVPRLSGIHR